MQNEGSGIQSAQAGVGNAVSQPVHADNDDNDEDEEDEHVSGSPASILTWSIMYMLGGTIVVAIFSGPMVDVITDFGDSIGVKPFYVSFIITPFCSNASELISSLIFAAKKRKKNSSLTYGLHWIALHWIALHCID
jgi:Ca2+/H+ antiporter